MAEQQEPVDARRRRLLMRNLEIANRRRAEVANIRRGLRDGSIDLHPLLRGDDDQWEGAIEQMEVQRLLKLIPGIGTARMIDVLIALDAPPTAKVGGFTYKRRALLSEAVRTVLEVRARG
jgi:hypothetical protein